MFLILMWVRFVAIERFLHITIRLRCNSAVVNTNCGHTSPRRGYRYSGHVDVPRTQKVIHCPYSGKEHLDADDRSCTPPPPPPPPCRYSGLGHLSSEHRDCVPPPPPPSCYDAYASGHAPHFARDSHVGSRSHGNYCGHRHERPACLPVTAAHLAEADPSHLESSATEIESGFRFWCEHSHERPACLPVTAAHLAEADPSHLESSATEIESGRRFWCEHKHERPACLPVTAAHLAEADPSHFDSSVTEVESGFRFWCEHSHERPACLSVTKAHLRDPSSGNRHSELIEHGSQTRVSDDGREVLVVDPALAENQFWCVHRHALECSSPNAAHVAGGRHWNNGVQRDVLWANWHNSSVARWRAERWQNRTLRSPLGDVGHPVNAYLGTWACDHTHSSPVLACELTGRGNEFQLVERDWDFLSGRHLDFAEAFSRRLWHNAGWRFSDGKLMYKGSPVLGDQNDRLMVSTRGPVNTNLANAVVTGITNSASGQPRLYLSLHKGKRGPQIGQLVLDWNTLFGSDCPIPDLTSAPEDTATP